MALKFGCKNCGEDVVVQFLKFPRLLNAKNVAPAIQFPKRQKALMTKRLRYINRGQDDQ